MTIVLDGTTGITTPGLTNTGTETIVSLTTTGNTTLGDATSDTLTVGVTGIVKDASGNVGIGTASPNAKLNVVASSGSTGFRMDGGLAVFYPSYATANQGLQVDTTNLAVSSNALFVNMPTSWTGNIISANLNGVQQFSVSQAGNGYYAGDLLVGSTSNSLSTKIFASGIIGAQQTYGPMFISNENNTDNVGRGSFNFQRGGTLVGQITTTNSTCAYNSVSDYRLKENIAPMIGALGKVAQLNPVTYKWKSNGLDGQGFIAHELQEVVPDCVAGEKDAVDADGKIIPQGIDTSFLVATLTAAIQEQQALITALTARITALETP